MIFRLHENNSKESLASNLPRAVEQDSKNESYWRMIYKCIHYTKAKHKQAM